MSEHLVPSLDSTGRIWRESPPGGSKSLDVGFEAL